MRAYYFLLLGIVNIYGLGQIKNYSSNFSPAYHSIAAIFNGTNYPFALMTSSVLLMIATMVAGLKVTWQWTRILVVLFLLLYAAVVNSTGGVTHLYQFWFWTSVALAFAPTLKKPNDIKLKISYLRAWSNAQAVFLVMYGLSGFWKMAGAIDQYLRAEPNLFSIDGLSFHLASEIIRANAAPMLGSLLFEHGSWQPLMAFLIVGLQLSCFVGVFLPRIRPGLGIFILMFHLGTFFFLSITYPTNVLLAPLLLMTSWRDLFVGAKD